MKYKLISILTIFVLLAAAISIQRVEVKNNRYHQHIEAQAKEPCTDHGEDIFCTHLPLISITTDAPIPHPYILDAQGQRMEDEHGVPVRNYETVSATVQYYDSPTLNNHLTDQPVFEEHALTRTRGATSRQYDKKGYAVNFKEKNLIDNKEIEISGMVPDEDWVLNGPYWDKSWIRNYLCYNLAGEIMEYAPNVRYCELFLNDEYMGLYLLIEKVKYNDGGRIKLTETDPDLASTSYILQIDRGTDDPLRKLQTFASMANITTKYGLSYGQLEIIYPSKTLTKEQQQYIENDISKFEKAVSSFDYNDLDKGYRQYIDVQSFVDYFIINEFTLNYDSMGLSTYLHKDIRGKLNLCVWDFNNAFDYYEYPLTEPHIFETQHKMWYGFLFRDKDFVDAVVHRYHKLRETVLSDEYLLNYIDDTVAFLGPALNRNNERWGYSFEQSISHSHLKSVERNPLNHTEAIQQLKDTIVERGEYMDEHIETLYSYSHDSVNKKYNHGTGGN